MGAHLNFCYKEGLTYQVQCGVKEDPYDIDKMPVDRRSLDRPHALRRVQTLPPIAINDRQENHAGEDMKGMKTGHGKENRCSRAIRWGERHNLPLHPHHADQEDNAQNQGDQNAAAGNPCDRRKPSPSRRGS